MMHLAACTFNKLGFRVSFQSLRFCCTMYPFLVSDVVRITLFKDNYYRISNFTIFLVSFVKCHFSHLLDFDTTYCTACKL